MGINCFIARLFPNYAKALPNAYAHTPGRCPESSDSGPTLTHTDMPLLPSCLPHPLQIAGPYGAKVLNAKHFLCFSTMELHCTAREIDF
jgi:hypothetical protein